MNLTNTGTRWDEFRRRLRVFFADARTELVIAVLILVSIVLILVELALPESGPRVTRLEVVNYAFLIVFAIELALRFIAASTEEHFVRKYFRRWWIDIIAVYPPLLLIPLEGLVVLRGLGVLRFLRLWRLGRIISSSRVLFPYVVRRGAVHFGLVTGAVLITIIVGTSVMLALERLSNPEIDSFGEAFWFSLYSLFAAEPIPAQPSTLEGRIASVFLMFMGLLVFAAFVGTVSALMVERLQKEEEMRGLEEIEDHVIVCGLGRVGYRIVKVLTRLDQSVVVIEREGEAMFVDRARRLKVPVIVADVRSGEALHDASIETARAVIACTDDDLTNLEIALDARSLRPDIRVVLRMFDERLARKVREGFNIQVALSVSFLAAPAFAAAALDRSVRGSLDVDGRVYIHSEFAVPENSSLVGQTVAALRDEYEVHTLSYQDASGVQRWSPPFDYRIEGGTNIAIVGPFDEVARLKEACGVALDLVRQPIADTIDDALQDAYVGQRRNHRAHPQDLA